MDLAADYIGGAFGGGCGGWGDGGCGCGRGCDNDRGNLSFVTAVRAGCFRGDSDVDAQAVGGN